MDVNVVIEARKGDREAFGRLMAEIRPALMEPMAVTPSRDQEWSVCDSVRIRTSWPRRSNSRCRFLTEVTTPFTAGVYQSVVIRIFMAGSLLSSCP